MRQWLVPSRPCALRMRWCDLLFAHWTVEPSHIGHLLPPSLELDLFEGRAYVGVVPFRMENVSPRWLPPVTGFHAFPELNVRTYVISGGKPGVWFFSLDAGQKLAVRIARRRFHLPYFDARFNIAANGQEIVYRATRTHRCAAPANFEAHYRPIGSVHRAVEGTLESWLTERYCLYSADGHNRLYRGEIDHAPWPLQKAEADIRVNTMGDWLGLELHRAPELLQFARSLDVRAWPINPVSASHVR